MRASVLRWKGERALEQEGSANPDGEQELAEPVGVGEREDAQDPIIGVEAQVLGECCSMTNTRACVAHASLPSARPVVPDV